MKKKILKRSYGGFEDDPNLNSNRKASAKGKNPKKRLSIYEDFEDGYDDFQSYEKFKKKRK